MSPPKYLLCVFAASFLLWHSFHYSWVRNNSTAPKSLTQQTESKLADKKEKVQDHILQVLPCPPLGDSQDNQDCIIEKIFKAIGTTNKYYVEYGFNSLDQCSGSGPNTCRLWKSGWNGLLMDGSYESEKINLKKHDLFADNIVSILEKHGVPKEPDYYSGDINSIDYFVMKSVLDSGKYRPRLISTEYNGNYPMDWMVSQVDPTIAHPDKEVPPEPAFYQPDMCTFGASAGAFQYLMKKHGYSLVAVTYLLDLFYVRNDILEENDLIAPPYQLLLADNVRKQAHRKHNTTEFLQYLVDVQTYEETKSYRQANEAVVQKILDHIKDPEETTIFCLEDVYPDDVEAYLKEIPITGRSHLVS